ncbi:MAG: PLP-dependent aminotransferase family protein [Chloroflexi bacterium]|nr:PLP-dependent aminotransferase family protein [Chloroflexota bacterium]
MTNKSPDYEQFLVRPNTGGAQGPREDYRYNFGTVLPGPDLLPLEELAEAARQAVLQQGHLLSFYPPPQGPEDARAFIARKMQEDRGLTVAPEELLLTNGSMEAIRLVLDNLVQPGDVIVTEQYLYQGSLAAFRRAGAEVVGVETDDQGMRTDRLAQALDELRGRGKKPKFIYTIPTFQNPEGTVLPPERRRDVLRLAQEHETLVYEDDCYVHERLDIEEIPATIASLPGAQEWVIYSATFSKIVGPGIRIGWLTAPAPVLQRITSWKLSGGNNYLSTMVVCRYLEQHWDGRLKELNRALRQRRNTMAAALDEHFGPQASFRLPVGGMFLWVGFPEAVDTGALQEKAVAAGVRYVPGIQFSPANGARNYCRLAFSYADPGAIREGIGVLARLLYREGLLPRG